MRETIFVIVSMVWFCMLPYGVYLANHSAVFKIRFFIGYAVFYICFFSIAIYFLSLPHEWRENPSLGFHLWAFVGGLAGLLNLFALPELGRLSAERFKKARREANYREEG